MKSSGGFRRESICALLTISCALALLPRVSRAEIVAGDSFAYESPTIRGCNGGDGWADAWTGDNFVSPGSLHFAGYETKGNRLTTLGDSAGRSDTVKCSFRTLATTGRDDLVVANKFGRIGTTLAVVPREHA